MDKRVKPHRCLVVQILWAGDLGELGVRLRYGQKRPRGLTSHGVSQARRSRGGKESKRGLGAMELTLGESRRTTLQGLWLPKTPCG